MFGQDEGTYLIDDFSLSVEAASLGLDVFEPEPIITLFPNPSRNFVTISTNLAVSSLKIFSSIGHLVYEQMNTNRINLDSYSVGNYILKIETTSGSSYYKKLIIK